MSSTTPTAAGSGQSRARPRARATATPSGPRNSNALAVPSGSRATAAMNSSVSPAVTAPSARQAISPDRLNVVIRGRTSTSRIAAAHTSRSQAAPSAPIRSMSPTETASPSCTHTIDTTANAAPERLGEKVTRSSEDDRNRSRPRDFT